MCPLTGPPALTVNIIKNTESSSIVVRWDEVDNSLPTTYVVTWTRRVDHAARHVTLIEQSSYTITGLTLDTVYTITVTASNRCGQGPEYRTNVSLTTDTTSTVFATSTSTMTNVYIASTASATITAVNPSTTTVAIADNASSSLTKTASFITTINSTNPVTLITTAIASPSPSTGTVTVMDPTSTVYPEANTTVDETSKFSSSCTCDWICKMSVIYTSNFLTLMRY